MSRRPATSRQRDLTDAVKGVVEIDQTQKILDTYLPRNRDLAEIAIGRLVAYKKRSKV
jgi:hypothetical protein